MKSSILFVALLAVGDAADLRSASKAGDKLMSKARKLNDNYNYYNWVKDYSIKFTGCSSIPSWEREEGVRNTLLANFKLCPSDDCDSCEKGGEYVVQMQDFVQAQMEATETQYEASCEYQNNYCGNLCDNGNYEIDQDGYANYYNANGNGDDYCLYQCMNDNGLGECLAEDEEEQADYEDLIECRSLNDNDDNAYGYYVGAHCVDGGVYLNTFTDSSCTEVAPEGTFYSQMGYNLPTSSLVTKECVSCKEPEDYDNDNQNDAYDQDAVMEVCEELYMGSGKCEETVEGTQYPDTSGCGLIKETLPSLNGGGKKVRTGKGAAWFFFLTTLCLGGYVFMLHKKQASDSSDYQGGRI